MIHSASEAVAVEELLPPPPPRAVLVQKQGRVELRWQRKAKKKTKGFQKPWKGLDEAPWNFGYIDGRGMTRNLSGSRQGRKGRAIGEGGLSQTADFEMLLKDGKLTIMILRISVLGAMLGFRLHAPKTTCREW